MNVWTIAAIALGIAAHLLLRTGARRLLWLSLPVLIFAAVLVALQWLGGAVDLRLPLRVVAVFLLSTALVRALPPPSLAACSPRSPFRLPLLFLLFVRHFTAILIQEARRTFQARRLCVSREFGGGAFQSLVWATAAMFRRSFDRAERFYAAQLIGGLPE